METYQPTRVLDAHNIAEIKDELKSQGIALVRIYEPGDPILVSYQHNMDSVMKQVRPDGGTAHGSKGMGGITKRYGGACTPEIWQIRLDSEVKKVYSDVYNLTGDDLFVGCDSYAALADDALRNPRKKEKNAEDRYFNLTGGSLKPHIDVHPTNMTTPGNKALAKLKTITPDFPVSLQGQLVLRPVPKGGATFVVAPGQHTKIDAAHFNDDAKGDFATCTPAGYEHFEPLWRAVDNLDAGILILWDSRLPHGNKLADHGVDPQRRGLFICWQPAALFEDVEDRSSLKKRKWRAITGGGTTDHWAAYVPGGDRGHRGGHYSNKHKRSKVIHSDENPVEFGPEMAQKIYDAL
ncbi:MAG: hypothetical protein CL450_07915 [Acidimicrobiaceae bacterium]|nr:hypothetical protein [Acidimicrobiaceae bacterium]